MGDPTIEELREVLKAARRALVLCQDAMNSPSVDGVTAALDTTGEAISSVDEALRPRGSSCRKCGHRHEGAQYQFQCFMCPCHERPSEEAK